MRLLLPLAEKAAAEEGCSGKNLLQRVQPPLTPKANMPQPRFECEQTYRPLGWKVTSRQSRGARTLWLSF